jgi:chemotaxis protein methyltransferase CheR
MRARGVHTFDDYARLLDADAIEYDRLLDALTINVTKLFRNWETYEAIARHVVPVLLAAPGSALRVWSAGCSSGEEPYSLAILFHRAAAGAGALDQLRRVSVLGTDIDRDSLAAAERGTFDEAAFADTPAELRRAYFTDRPPFALRADVRGLVSFERRDLLRDPPPPGPHHLVACRNVLIYFDRSTQEQLFERFHAALAPRGFLVLGKVETVLGRARSLFAAENARQRIFRRA